MDTQSPPTQMPTTGHSHLSINEVFKEAWHNVHGFKGTFWLALIILFLVAITFGFVQSFLTHNQHTDIDLTQHVAMHIAIVSGLISIVANIVNTLLVNGLYYIALRRTQNLPILSRMIFTSFQSPYLLRLIAVFFIKILIVVPYVAIVLLCASLMPNMGQWHIEFIVAIVISTLILIYFMLRLILSELIIFDKKLSAWSAIKLSFHSTSGCVLRIFWIVILEVLLIIISAIPLGIGLIWSLPIAYLLMPSIYKNLIGISIKE